jgi:predicted HTH domain antitoxin
MQTRNYLWQHCTRGAQSAGAGQGCAMQGNDKEQKKVQAFYKNCQRVLFSAPAGVKWVKSCKFNTMKVLTVNVPDSLDMDSKQLAMLTASRLYEQGKLSLGQAAEVAGLTKRTFAELLGSYNVSVFNFPASDLSSDVANA